MHKTALKYFVLLLCFFVLLPASARKFLLVIDAGHGGHDAGAVGGFSMEKDINLNVALAFGKLVEKNCDDVKVIYTRQTDVFIPLQERADIANKANADLFISIHTNSVADGHAAYGCETYTLCMDRANANLAVAKRENSVITYEKGYKTKYQGFDPNKAESYIIFEFMQNKYMKQSVELANCIQQQYTRAGRPDKGVKQANLLVLRNTSMPSVLTELGFINTPSEEEFLNSPEGVRILSTSIYNGFLQYLKSYSGKRVDVPRMIDVKNGAGAGGGKIRFNNDDDEAEVVPVETKLSKREQRKREAARKQEKEKEKKKEETAKSKDGKEGSKTDAAAKPAKPAEEKKPAAAPAKKPAETTTKKPVTPPAKEKPAAKPAAKDTAPAKPAAKQAEKEKTAAKPAAPQSKAKETAAAFRIQVASTKAKPKESQTKMNGYDVTVVQKGTMYAYMVGNYATRAEANKDLPNVQKQFPQAFVVQMSTVKPAADAKAQPAKAQSDAKGKTPVKADAKTNKAGATKPAAEKTPAKADAKNAKADTKTAKPAAKDNKAKTTPEKPAATKGTVYKIQFATSPTATADGDARIKKVQGTTSYKVGKVYAFVVGNYKTRAAAQQALKAMKKDFPDAFIVTFVDGKRATN